MTVQLYHWDDAQCVANYGSGDLIVMASSLEEAKATLRKAFNRRLERDEDWRYIFDPEEECSFESRKAELEKDLALEPRISVGPAAIIIRGSD